MASTKMFTKNHHPPNATASSFFQQQQTPSSAQYTDEETTLTQEMHVKMAKKIAQLTKVIYALNTKADEQETIVANLKQAFEQEKAALATHASARIDDLLHRVESLSSIKYTQNSLFEDKIRILESERQNQTDELTRIQKSAVERERQISDDFRAKLAHVKQKIDNIKRTYDDQLAKLTGEHRQNVDQLREQHQMDIDQVKIELKHTFDIETEAQTKFYTQTLEELRRENAELLSKYQHDRSTKDEFGEEFLKEKQQLEKQIKVFEQKIEQIRIESEQEISERDRELRTRMNDCEQLRDELEQYKKNQGSQSEIVTGLNEQLSKLRNEQEQLRQRAEQTNREMNTLKERYNRQASELEDKLKLLKDKDSTNRQLDGDLVKCRKELQLTNARLRQMEEDQHAQLSQSESTSNYLERRIYELDKTIHEMTLEKQQIMLKYDRELTIMRETYESQVTLCKTEMQNELNRLGEHYEQLSNDEQARAKAQLQLREQQLHQQYELEKAALLEQWKSELLKGKSEQNEVSQELRLLKENYTKQIDELKKRLQENENELSTARSQLNSAQSSKREHTKQIAKLNGDLEKQQSVTSQLQSERDSLKTQYDQLEIRSVAQLKEELDKLTSELNEKWSKTLKLECEKIRRELIEQKDRERKMSIEEIQRLKQAELTSTKTRSEELEQQLQQLKKQFLAEQEKHKEENLIALQNVNEDKRRTVNEFNMRIQDLTTQLQRLEAKNQDDLFQQKLRLEKDHVLHLNDMKSQHLEDIRAQQLAYNTHLTSVRADHERAIALEIEKHNVQSQSNLELLRKEFTQKHASEFEEHQRAHAKEVAAVRIQLDRALEITKIKEREADLRIEDLTSDLQLKQTRVDSCVRDLNELQIQLDELRTEIDLRSKEVQRVRSETQKELKHREEAMRSENEQKFEDLAMLHQNEQKQLLEEFSTAHELLKTRVGELQSQLTQAEQRYRDRESRPEDLELVATLQQTIVSYQDQLKKIHDEKKHLKMELVNRETNFNKVFTNAPSNVGVMNPRSYNTKFIPRTSDVSLPSRLKSQSPRPSKLEPLTANSDIPHDMTLNPNRPLPPKRFVK